jgi:hypothetical protein
MDLSNAGWLGPPPGAAAAPAHPTPQHAAPWSAQAPGLAQAGGPYQQLHPQQQLYQQPYPQQQPYQQPYPQQQQQPFPPQQQAYAPPAVYAPAAPMAPPPPAPAPAPASAPRGGPGQGRKRAVLVGCCYPGTSAALNGWVRLRGRQPRASRHRRPGQAPSALRGCPRPFKRAWFVH